MKTAILKPQVVAALPIAIGINLALAFFVNLVKVPLFLDSTGTILMGALFGPLVGALAGVLSNAVAGVILNPVYFYFVLTAAYVGAMAGVAAKRMDFSRLGWLALVGAVVGIGAAVLSAPVATYVFQGVTPAGSYSVIVAFVKATGQTLLKSTLLAGLSSDPLDKAVSFVLAGLALRSLSPSVRARLGASSGD